MVSSVNVKIENPDGTLAEEGLAVADETGLDYIFTAKKKNASLEGDKITIEVNDLPGNETVVSQVL
jgi:hypothetical protein